MEARPALTKPSTQSTDSSLELPHFFESRGSGLKSARSVALRCFLCGAGAENMCGLGNILSRNIMASLADIFSVGCGDDVSEARSEEQWIDCKVRRNFPGMIIAVCTIIVIVVILMFFGGMWFKVITFFIAVLAVGSLLLTHFFWVPAGARVEYVQFRYDVERLIREGKTEAEALTAIREFKERRQVAQDGRMMVSVPDQTRQQPSLAATATTAAISSAMANVFARKQ